MSQYRVVVPTNEGHLVKSKQKLITYGKNSPIEMYIQLGLHGFLGFDVKALKRCH